MVCFEVSIYSICVIFLHALKIHKKLGIVTHVCDLGPGWGERWTEKNQTCRVFHGYFSIAVIKITVKSNGSTGLDIHTVREGIVVVTGS